MWPELVHFGDGAASDDEFQGVTIDGWDREREDCLRCGGVGTRVAVALDGFSAGLLKSQGGQQDVGKKRRL